MAKPKNFEVVEDSEIHDLDDHGMEQQAPAYEQVMSGERLEHYIEDIADTVRVGLDQSISILTPWFFNNMPTIYYQTTPRQEKVRHLSAIITGHVFETKQTVELWDRDRTKVTYIGPGGDSGILTEMAVKMKDPFKMGALYFSRDRLLFLSTFFTSDFRAADRSNKRITEKMEAARRLLHDEYPKEKDAVNEYIDHLDHDFVMYATARRIQLTFGMVLHMMEHEGAHTKVEPFDNSARARLTIGMKNMEPNHILESVIHLIHRYQFTIRRTFIAHFTEGRDEPIAVMHLIVENSEGKKITIDDVPMRRLTKAFRTLGWVDVDEYDLFTRDPHNLSINGANFFRSMAHWIHLSLGKSNPHIYSLYKVQTTYFKHAELVIELLELFRIKFDPLKCSERDKGEYDNARAKVESAFGNLIEEVERDIFTESLNFVDHILKTNYFMQTKTGLAFRMDPGVLNRDHYPNTPFGFFFIVGRDFRFFQVRWKDIARGGLRVVMPRGQAEYDYALAGLFDEVYGLSHAQQLKNKDIPEGGSKAVLVLRPNGHRDQAVRGAVNALLDLLVAEDESHEGSKKDLMDYFGKEEILYLGPDENMTNELINWITEQAKRRGYEYANAFMSSKPGAGINHKEYGVTSEGVNVFVHNMLHFLGIDPRQDKFTVKLTGGPDGDVAGNELKILHREYGENARVVAIADGFGAAFDPEGLQWQELLRLVHEGLSIDHFQANNLSKNKTAYVIKADSPENTIRRNELCFKAYADVFVPAGGRPYTVNEKNVANFFDEDGNSSCKAVVEGANIFFTPEARNELQRRGVLSIKDSSANKTGVICSSYEIIGALVLSPKEFNELKEEYVAQVTDILRTKADQEAKLLFREFSNFGGEKSLVDLSLLISQEINEVTDALLEQLSSDTKSLDKKMFESIVIRHCPPVLVAKYGKRILKKLPYAHQIAIVSAFIASNIVYREGLGWLHRIPEEERFKAARTYMSKEIFAQQLIDDLDKVDVPNKDLVTAILQRSAARDLTMIEIESHG